MEPRRRGLLVALVAAATTAVVGVLLAGPLRVDVPRWVPPQLSPGPVPSATAPVGPRLPPAGAEGLRALNTAIVVVLAVLGVVALAAVLIWLAARARRIRLTLDRPTPEEAAGPGAGRDLDPALAAPVVRSVLTRALDTLDRARSPGDAVVRAWQALEDAASEAGAARDPAETPSEYAVRIIRRFDSDRAAADELRMLYERVRFGGRPADAGSVADARRCLTALLASWSDRTEQVRG